MLILAIDTSTSAITVALHDDTRVLAAESHLDPRAHTEWVSPLIASCLASAGRAPGDLTAVAVGNGPGPFTGLRVGIVTGLTMGHALGVPVHGICSLDVLAAQAAEAASGGEGELLPMPRVDQVRDLDDPARGYPVITGDYSATPRWESRPVVAGTPIAAHSSTRSTASGTGIQSSTPSGGEVSKGSPLMTQV